MKLRAIHAVIVFMMCVLWVMIWRGMLWFPTRHEHVVAITRCLLTLAELGISIVVF